MSQCREALEKKVHGLLDIGTDSTATKAVDVDESVIAFRAQLRSRDFLSGSGKKLDSLGGNTEMHQDLVFLATQATINRIVAYNKMVFRMEDVNNCA